MNSDIIKGSWEQMKGRIRQQWGKLTDDDLERIKGDRDVLLGTIQRRYGQTREEAEASLERWLGSDSGPTAHP